MTYAVIADLETRFGQEEVAQLADRVGLGAAADEIVASAVADASAEIDGYLAGGYTLPLATVPPLVTRIACDMARYYLYRGTPSESARVAYEDALVALKRIADGVIKLTVSGVVADGDASIAAPTRDLAFGSDFETAFL